MCETEEVEGLGLSFAVTLSVFSGESLKLDQATFVEVQLSLKHAEQFRGSVVAAAFGAVQVK